MRRLSVLTAVVTFAVCCEAATAQFEPEDFTPPGYEFCGWKNFSTGSWTMTNPQDGAFLRGFARNLSCQAARRNISRVSYSRQPPYQPRRTGYRCQRLKNQYEYTDARCTKLGGSATFRFQTGS